MSKPVLYVFGASIWAAIAELAVAEQYKDGEIELKTVDLIHGENFLPAFLAINPNATVPTLETPDEGVKTSTRDVVKYLNEHAGKKVKPATEISDKIHEEGADPNFALLLTRNEEELKAKAASLPGVFVGGRQAKLEEILAGPDYAKHKDWYDAKAKANGGLKAIYDGKVSDEVKEGFFKQSQDHFTRVSDLIYVYIPSILPEQGFIAGEVPGVDDYHVGAWLTRIAATVGAVKVGDDGPAFLEKAHGNGKPLPAKVKAYWKAWEARETWKKVYAGGLH